VTSAPLPPEIEELIDVVLRAADLEFTDGRREVEQELRAHFEDGLAKGVSAETLIVRFGDPVEAGRRIARTRPGAAARNRGERRRWWMSGREWWDEVRRAARRLTRAPGFAAVVIVTLALGIGANTAIFTVLDAVLLKDLPYAEPDRLVRIHEGNPEDVGGEYLRVPLIVAWRGWDEVFDELGALYTYREMGADLTSGDRPERVHVLWVSAGYFEALGIAPHRGRTFTEDESYGPGEATGRTEPIAHTAVISHALWARIFEGSDDALGRTIELDGESYEVVGVMPRGFKNPFGTDSDVWLPYDMRLGGSNHYRNWFLSGVARLRDGVTLEQARERVRAIAEAHHDSEPETFGAYPRLLPLHQEVVGPTRARMLWILAGAAGMVLLTACLNVTNLLVARGLSRDRDLALRSALGSGRARLVVGILAENGLLAVAGGAAGLALGVFGVKALVALAPGVVPMVTEIRMGGAVFGFTTAVTIGALLLFGMTPALRMSRTAPAEVLRSGDRTSTTGRASRRVRDGLVIAQVGVALALVAGAALFTRSFSSLVNLPLGLDPEGVLTFEVHLPEARYPDGAARHAFHEQLHDRIAALPAVDEVGAVSWLPVKGRYHSWGFYWDPENPDGSNDDAWYGTDVRVVAGDYLAAMGIDLLSGVGLGEVDLDAEPMVWINRTVVDEVFGEDEALGQQIVLAGDTRRVMGIVDDVAHDSRGSTTRKSYVPHAQFAGDRNWALTQTVRARGDLGQLTEQIRTELGRIDGQLVLFEPRTADALLSSVREQDRFAALLMACFAGLALVLSLVGTYGVLAGSVAARSREIGIRTALGASTQEIRAMVLRYAARLVVPGTILGLAGAWVGAGWIRALLFEVDARDPLSLSATVLLFLVIGLASAWLPARRATRVDTVEVLTAE
jgi:putative ABC transport system permease protein